MENDDHALVRLMLDLDQGPREEVRNGYQLWALSRVQQDLRFDAAVWLSGHLADDIALVRRRCVLNARPRSLRALTAIPERLGPVRGGEPVTVNSADARLEGGPGLPGHLLALSRHALCSFRAHPVSRVFTCMSFHRLDRSGAFSRVEQRFCGQIVPLLIRYSEREYLQELVLRSESDQTTRFRAAEVDGSGRLQAVETGFDGVVRSEWPMWRGPSLPEDLAPYFRQQRTGEYIGRHISVRMTPTRSGAWLLRVRKKAGLELCSPRERLIAEHCAKGLQNKQIAKALGISPNTVRNQLQDVYEKLGVNSRVALVRLINREHDSNA